MDGPVEGVVRSVAGGSCWYFKLFAERAETSDLNDRLFGLWPVPEQDAEVLCEEYASSDRPLVWPVSGGIGSERACAVVERILASEPGLPELLVKTQDFSEVLGAWSVVSE
ncbi:hypothetical protein OG462_09850 [Streptomyces sp. NBC_01077]|uniref:hypothetical protein n=1 Tax=Streptomyces sp. NBC_01077 TaxID=2903746 RepID=UPI0038673475|nr:hypothetical protein OG462_09850 [Streptomyces sp. NBC_01077]